MNCFADEQESNPHLFALALGASVLGNPGRREAPPIHGSGLSRNGQ